MRSIATSNVEKATVGVKKEMRGAVNEGASGGQNSGDTHSIEQVKADEETASQLSAQEDLHDDQTINWLWIADKTSPKKEKSHEAALAKRLRALLRHQLAATPFSPIAPITRGIESVEPRYLASVVRQRQMNIQW